MRLDRNLLMDGQTYNRGGSAPDFHATTKAHGLYSTQQFVLRLSPLVHRKLASLDPGITTSGAIGFDGAQAMSTLLHETVHWWQHIGSTYGIIYSLNYPVQTHSTHASLKRILEAEGFKKSILRQSTILGNVGPSGLGTISGTANSVVNNHFDLLAFRSFTLGAEYAKHLVQEELFESVGHSMHMTYANTINIIASTVDRNFAIFHHPKDWEGEFRKLNENKTPGYFYKSPVGLWPVGSHEIFEGQARFAQVQFLSFASGHNLNWQDFADIGMLDGIYVRAFNLFLKLTESNWPQSVNDPLVGLFLLICDLSINPGRGFPFDIAPNFETFIDDVNPGARFSQFCRLVATKFPNFKTAIKDHSRSEYEEVSNELSLYLKEFPPLSIADKFSRWFLPSGALSDLRRQYDEYSFGKLNFVIGHLFAHFLAFQEDKFKTPEFFCWPGAWMAGANLSTENYKLFQKHSAIFVDKENDDGVFPALQLGRNEERLHDTFSNFYDNAVVYDLTNQWISENDSFKYDVSWLVSGADEATSKAYMRRQFSAAFGVDPNDALIL